MDRKDITNLIQDLKEKKLLIEEYENLIDQNLFSIAVAENPREVKRFLNNFIVAYEIFHTIDNFEAKELLLLQAIQLGWSGFYNLLMKSDEKFLTDLNKYIQMNEDTRLKTLGSDDVKEVLYLERP